LHEATSTVVAAELVQVAALASYPVLSESVQSKQAVPYNAKPSLQVSIETALSLVAVQVATPVPQGTQTLVLAQ
jgi:hypothetical protein